MKIMIFSRDSFVELWKRRMGFETPRTDSVITRGDGPDVNVMAFEQASSWYVGVLKSMPVESLPLTDISGQLVAVASPPGAAAFLLPDGCMKVAEVTADGWLAPARIIVQPGATEALAQLNPYSCAGPLSPVALVSGRRMIVYPSSTGDTMPEVMGVMEPDGKTFTLTSDMISQMPILKIET